MIDYDRMAGELEATRLARILPPELVAQVQAAPLTVQERRGTVEWLRRQSAPERDGFATTLHAMRQQWDADQAGLDAMWQGFGDAGDRALALVWWMDGHSVEEIARRFGWIYLAEIGPEDIAAWQHADRWPERGDAFEGTTT